jgi:hypothetical protein
MKKLGKVLQASKIAGTKKNAKMHKATSVWDPKPYQVVDIQGSMVTAARSRPSPETRHTSKQPTGIRLTKTNRLQTSEQGSDCNACADSTKRRTV